MAVRRREWNGETIYDSADIFTSGDRLVLCALLLALKRNVADVLLMWEVKRLDFDMVCHFDVQLLAFAGLDEVLSFLREQLGTEATAAAEYIEMCMRSGDFDDLDRYLNYILSYFEFAPDEV